MAETKTKTAPADEAKKTEVPVEHDRIAVPSRRVDGSLDQTHPEFIGDKDATVTYAKDQLATQAVSAADVVARQGSTTSTEVEGAKQDPTIDELTKTHEAVAKTVEAAAEAEVEALHKGAGA